MGSQRVRHDWVTFTFKTLEDLTSVCLWSPPVHSALCSYSSQPSDLVGFPCLQNTAQPQPLLHLPACPFHLSSAVFSWQMVLTLPSVSEGAPALPPIIIKNSMLCPSGDFSQTVLLLCDHLLCFMSAVPTAPLEGDVYRTRQGPHWFCPTLRSAWPVVNRRT